MTKQFFEVALTDNTTTMIDLAHVARIVEKPECFEVVMSCGEKLEVIPQTMVAALNEAKVAYFRFERGEAPEGSEPAEEVPVVEGEVIPA